MPKEPVLPEGKLVRTTSGGTDALKKVLVDLKRYSFSGYVKTRLPREGGDAIGYVLVADGNPELALHGTGDKTSQGKVALKAVWEDSYSEQCAIEIHAKVDLDAIRRDHPKAGLERARRTIRATKSVQADPEGKVKRWREAGYRVDSLAAALRDGGDAAKKALADFEAAVIRIEPLKQALDGFTDPSLRERVEGLREQTRDPANVEAVEEAIARLRTDGESAAAPPASTDRAREVYEMIVRHRAAEGKQPEVTQSQVATAIAAKPPAPDERTSLIPQYTFEAFVVGPSNRFAHAASLAVAKSPHTAYNPLFITSGPGLGKTHLLNAIGNAILAGSAGAKVVYVTAEGFSNEFQEARAGNRLQDFRARYRNVDVALFDDAQFLSGKGDVQEELFHTFNDLYNATKQIVLTSDRPPKEIPDLEDRLVSRFESGLVADIQPPEYETRQAILQRKANDAGVSVDDEIIAFIARRVRDNIRELAGALNRVLAFSSLMGQPVSLDLAKEVLKDLGEPEEARTAKTIAQAAKEVRPGHAYLIEEPRPDHAFRLVGPTASNGGVLVVTRANPRRVREKFNLNAERVLWLTERESGKVETIPPSLEQIMYVIEAFMHDHESGAILLDGVEYLASSSGFDAVLKFLRRLVDHVSESPYVLLVSVSPKTMKEQEIRNLEREMEVLAF